MHDNSCQVNHHKMDHLAPHIEGLIKEALKQFEALVVAQHSTVQTETWHKSKQEKRRDIEQKLLFLCEMRGVCVSPVLFMSLIEQYHQQPGTVITACYRQLSEWIEHTGTVDFYPIWLPAWSPEVIERLDQDMRQTFDLFDQTMHLLGSLSPGFWREQQWRLSARQRQRLLWTGEMLLIPPMVMPACFSCIEAHHLGRVESGFEDFYSLLKEYWVGSNPAWFSELPLLTPGDLEFMGSLVFADPNGKQKEPG